MRNKILALVCVLAICMSSVFAYTNADVLDVRIGDGNYTASQAAEIKLPFVRILAEDVVLDKNIDKAGVTLAQGKVEVTGTLGKMQLISSGEKIVLKGKVDNVICVAPEVVVEGEVTGMLVNFSEKLDVKENAKINEMYTNSAKLVMLGKVEQNLLANLEYLELKGEVGKDLRASVEKIKLDANKVHGDVFFKTHNSNLDAKYVYPKAEVKVLAKPQLKEQLKIDVLSSLLVATSILLVYWLMQEIGKKKLATRMVEKIKAHRAYIYIFAATSFFAFPLILVLGMLILLVGFVDIAVALLALAIGVYIAVVALSMYITTIYYGNRIAAKVTHSKLVEYVTVFVTAIAFSMLAQMFVPFALLVNMLAFGIFATLLVKGGEY